MQLQLTALALAFLSVAAAAPRPQGAPADTCPVPCDPVNPGASTCDPTASCTPVGPTTLCACRAGYRADGAKDDPKSARLPFPGQEFRVFVPPGTACNTLCGDASLGAKACSEVPSRDKCLAQGASS